MADETEIQKLAKSVADAMKRVEAELAKTQALATEAQRRVGELEHIVEDLTHGQVVSSTMPPMFAAMVHQIHRGEIVWDVEQFGIAHEVVDGIGTCRAHATILGVPVLLMRVVEKKTGRAGYIARRPDGEELVFRVASSNGRLLAPSQLDDVTKALSDDETRNGAAAREKRDADRRAAEEAEIRAELQRRGARQ